MRASLAVAAMLLVAAPAQAAQVEMVRVKHVEGRETYFDRTVTFSAAPGERNDLTISADLNDTTGTGAITLTDASAELSGTGGCKRASAHVVVCSSESDPFGRVTADVGDRDDSVHVASTVRYGPQTTLAGGAGNDAIDGSALSEAIDGGPGDDSIDGGDSGDLTGDSDRVTGGGGRDRMNGRGGDFLQDGDDEASPDSDVFIGDGTTGITYAGRKRSVTIDLDGGTAGAPGEGDEISGIAYAHGGTGDDFLRGSDRPNFLNGHGGDDSIQGRGGHDVLEGGPGRDIAYGGTGNDTFWSAEDDAADTTHCGSGDDRLEGQDARDVVRRDCERAGWSMFGSSSGSPTFDNSITVRPAFRTSALDFRTTCPSEQCYGTIELRTRRSRKLLARGRFAIAGRKSGTIRARVNERGRELLFERPGRYVRVVIRSDAQRACPACIAPRGATTGFTTIVKR